MAGRKQQPGQAGSKGEQAPSSTEEEGQKAGTWFQVGACSRHIPAALLGRLTAQKLNACNVAACSDDVGVMRA